MPQPPANLGGKGTTRSPQASARDSQVRHVEVPRDHDRLAPTLQALHVSAKGGVPLLGSVGQPLKLLPRVRDVERHDEELLARRGPREGRETRAEEATDPLRKEEGSSC